MVTAIKIGIYNIHSQLVFQGFKTFRSRPSSTSLISCKSSVFNCNLHILSSETVRSKGELNLSAIKKLFGQHPLLGNVIYIVFVDDYKAWFAIYNSETSCGSLSK